MKWGAKILDYYYRRYCHTAIKDNPITRSTHPT